ncbi:MAG: glycosyltransferase family 9 protein [Bacteroidota bacterium]
MADRLAGGIMIFFLSLFAGKRAAMPVKAAKILLCKFYGMGSIIQITPLLASLKKTYPGAELVFVTSARNTALVGSIPLIDRGIFLKEGGFPRIIALLPGLLRQVRREKADVFIDLEVYSNTSAILCRLSRAGFKTGLYKKAQRTRLYDNSVYFDTERPIVDSYLQFSDPAHSRQLFLIKGHEDPDGIRSKLRLPPGTDKLIVVNVNASDLRIERRWPPAQFARLVSLLALRHADHFFVFTGSSAERGYTQSVIRLLDPEAGKKAINSAGQLSFAELVTLFHMSTLIITNDTGPMHLAAAMNKNTVALFGPCAPAQYLALPHITVIYKKVSCSPCVHTSLISPCRGDNTCMKQISPEEVLKACERLLEPAPEDQVS